MNIRVNNGCSRQAGNSAIATDHMSGFGNGFGTEALGGASMGPKLAAALLLWTYAEQLSGAPFTA